MKKIFYLSAIMLSVFSLAISCKKTDSGTGINVAAVAPTVTTIAATNVAAPTATAGGNITSDGGSIVMEAGVCYDTIAGVTTAKNKQIVYTVAGNYNLTLANLVMGKTYYYKAYAINGAGISYGAEMSFLVPFSINGFYYSSQIAASNLVAYWGFEGGYVDSVSKTVGTPNHTTAISFVTGLKGKAVQVVSPGYINTNITNTIAKLENFTMTCWIKQPSSLSSGPATFMAFSLNSAGFSWEQTKFFMLFNNSDNATGSYGKIGLMDQWFDQGQVWPKMLDGNWHQMAITFNGGSGALRVYVDGNLLSQSKSTALAPQTNFGIANSFTLGGPDDNANSINGWMNSLSGYLDEFRVYNTDLTAVQVQALNVLESHGL
jgi:hypothetical protein